MHPSAPSQGFTTSTSSGNTAEDVLSGFFFFSETALLVPYPWMTASQGLSEAAGGLQDPGSRRAELPLSLTLVVCLESSSPMSHGHHLKIQ